MIACLVSAALFLIQIEREGTKDEGTQEAAESPSAEQVARAVTGLREALAAGDAGVIRLALESAQTVPHPSVVREVLRGLEDERQGVKLAALQALRWLDHRDALEALHRAAKERTLMKVPELAAALLRGIGQHAEPGSTAVLAHDPFQPFDYACLRARIFGLARIRTLESLEALLGILAVTGRGPSGERRIKPQMADVRLGLMLLTGVDQGLSPELWEQWWRENRRTFRFTPEPAPLPKELRSQWDGFWGLPRVYEREGRREDRGQQPATPPRTR